MAITKFQKSICKIIANNRKKHKISYVAGGVALNHLIGGARLSYDIDIFNDSIDAVWAGFELDKNILIKNNYSIEMIRDRNSFIEVLVSKNEDSILMQWTADSCYRFFPLVEDDDFGLTLSPFDLATNKVLALVGRLEIRDWIDIISCSDKVQHLGYLAYAACAKDPGFSPAMILQEATRSSHYSKEEYKTLKFKNDDYDDLSVISQKWKKILSEAKDIVNELPFENIESCVMTKENELYTNLNINIDNIKFHKASMYGSYPIIP